MMNILFFPVGRARRVLAAVVMLLLPLCETVAAEGSIDTGLVPMSDAALAGVVAREGVGTLLELRINADENGAPLASLSSCTGIGNPCRLGLKFANRDGGGGEWIVLKDFFGRLFLDGLNIDGSFNPATSTAYYDATRFQDDNGTCLLAGCDPNGLPALMLSFTGTAGVFEADVILGLEIGRIAIEYGSTGFQADANGSFAGVRVADAELGRQTQIDIDGKVRIYGY
ncbi:hypothetical protein [Alcanivorax sp.]|uniref:hypothetical protein n=1 Tax=Alcanivorax sp. TaxID=1872427 RepID=UPI0025BF4E3C|nr:hypothetical protein [Alcanivorax sp.]